MSFTLSFESFPPPSGTLQYASIPWDSQIYGFPFYLVECCPCSPDTLDGLLGPWLACLPSTTACLVMTKVASDNIVLIRTLIQHGFYPIETQLSFSLALNRYAPSDSVYHPETLHLRRADSADMHQLIALAEHVFTTDRFHLDPNLPHHKASIRYASWIENAYRDTEILSIYGEPSSATIAGFVHVRTHETTIDLNLVAIAPSYQGKGIGQLMIHAVLAACLHEGNQQGQPYQYATTRTSINNLAGINLYTRFGFSLRTTTTILHWYRQGATQ
jgi:ribosomal protein S18 acetylase RimI-like enzyme